jgi:hypothetical protein
LQILYYKKTQVFIYRIMDLHSPSLLKINYLKLFRSSLALSLFPEICRGTSMHSGFAHI